MPAIGAAVTPPARFALSLRLGLIATFASLSIVLIADRLAGFVPARLRGVWTRHIVATQAHVVDRFFPFDARWYQLVADHGYGWDPARAHEQQNIAFFPLWPLLLRLVALCAPQPLVARWVVVIAAGGIAAASVIAFHRLAVRLLPSRAANRAALLFALYPGACFIFLAYPTGLMNLLCILALLALMNGRFFAAAIASLLLTATGPLGLGTALTIGTCAALRAWRRWRQNATIAAWLREAAILCAIGTISAGGLLAFIAWQFVAFGNGFAFIAAQQGWVVPLPFWPRAEQSIKQLLIVPDFIDSAAYLARALHGNAKEEIQKAIYAAILGLGLIGVIASARLRCFPVLAQGIFTMLLFVWFDSASRPGNATLRLIYGVIGMFLGLAWMLRDRPRVMAGIIALSGGLLGGAAFLAAAGYTVI